MKFLAGSDHFLKFCGHRPCGSSDAAVEMFAWPCDQRIWWLYGRKLLSVYSHPAKIDSHRHFVNGYVIILVCHISLQDCVTCHVTLEIEFTQGKSSSWHILWHCGSGDITILVCHVILQYHRTKGVTCLVAIGTVVAEI